MATEQNIIFYSILGGATIIGVVVYLIIKYEKDRQKVLKELSLKIGMTYKKDCDLTPLISQFKIFNNGFAKKTSNLLEGRRSNINWKIFEYQYTLNTGKSSSTIKQTVFLAELEKALPNFILKPEHIFHKIGNIIGYKDIDFERNPEFSKKYFLRGKDENKIKEIFTPEVLNYFEQNPIKATIEVDGNKIIYYSTGKRIKPKDLNSKLEDVSKIINLISHK